MHRLRRALGLMPLLVALTAVLLSAPPPAPPLSTESTSPEIAQADALVRQAMASEGYPGLAIAVSVQGRTVWAEGYGYANLEHRIPVWPQTTRFRIGSISKPFTAVAVAQLHAAGELDVDAPVQTYVPAFPEKTHPVTTRQLGAHLGGIRHYRNQEFLLNERFATVDEGLAIFQDDPLMHEPGSRYAYSSYGWNLISAVVEGASGQDFLPHMTEHVFRPLGMHQTVADHADSLITQRTGFYTRGEDGTLLNAPAVDNSYKWAGGGFLSTVTDLLLFARAMMDGETLPPEAQALLFTEQQTTAGEGVQYGFGWRVASDEDGDPLWSHTGGSVGGTSILVLHPATQVAVAMSINQSGADLDVGREVLALFVAAEEERAGMD
ncbi:MAG: serine hydrolase domain-containing protein [Bacteroidota bacterium]